VANLVSIEPLEEAEIIFVLRRYQQASKDYMRIMNVLLLSSGVIPVIIACMFWLFDGNPELIFRIFFFLLFALLFFFIIIACVFYFLQVFNKYRDATLKTKFVERCAIREKKYVQVNNTFHFYVDSQVTYSIEIAASEYNDYEVGDEINIEYSRYDKVFLGYF